jgi:hypothetical protein
MFPDGKTPEIDQQNKSSIFFALGWSDLIDSE